MMPKSPMDSSARLAALATLGSVGLWGDPARAILMNVIASEVHDDGARTVAALAAPDVGELLCATVCWYLSDSEGRPTTFVEGRDGCVTASVLSVFPEAREVERDGRHVRWVLPEGGSPIEEVTVSVRAHRSPATVGDGAEWGRLMATYPAHVQLQVGPPFWSDSVIARCIPADASDVIGGLLEALLRALWQNGAARDADTLRACPPGMRQADYMLTDESRAALTYVARSMRDRPFDPYIETFPVDPGEPKHPVYLAVDRGDPHGGTPVKLCGCLGGAACAREIVRYARMKRIRYTPETPGWRRGIDDFYAAMRHDRATVGSQTNRY